MQNQYFDNIELKRIQLLIEKDLYLTRKKYEEYIQKYPQDYSALTYYAGLLITLGDFDAAKNILILINKIIYEDKYVINTPEKLSYIKRNIEYNTLRILSYQNKYDEFLNLYQSVDKEIKKDLKGTLIYIKTKNNETVPQNMINNGYLFNQIINYNEEYFLEHVKYHSYENNLISDNPKRGIFSRQFPLLQVIAEIKKLIPNNNRICPWFIEDVYFYKYNSCGSENNINTDMFKVICIHDTDNIITMYPTTEYVNCKYTDLSYIVEEHSEHKTKKITRIDKFNKRYKLS